MSLRSKLKIENFGMFTAFIFYVIVGIVCFIILAIADFRLVHIGIIGTLSLIAGYGLLKSRVWTFWVIVALFFITTTFSAYTLYNALGRNLLLDVSMILYLILTWIFTAYTAMNRKTLQS